MENCRSYIVLRAIVIVAATFGSPKAFADMVPADFRLNVCDPAGFAELATYDSVGRIVGSSVSRPWGNITGPNVLGVSWRLWFFDAGALPPGWDSGTLFIEGLQPMGYYNTGGGIDYNFQDTLFPSDYGLYGYSPVVNTVDEGAVEDYPLTIYAQLLTGDGTAFYDAFFISGPLMSGFTGTLGQNDVYISDQLSVVPVPGAFLLGVLGLGIVGVKLRHNVR